MKFNMETSISVQFKYIYVYISKCSLIFFSTFLIRRARRDDRDLCNNSNETDHPLFPVYRPNYYESHALVFSLKLHCIILAYCFARFNRVYNTLCVYKPPCYVVRKHTAK